MKADIIKTDDGLAIHLIPESQLEKVGLKTAMDESLSLLTIERIFNDPDGNIVILLNRDSGKPAMKESPKKAVPNKQGSDKPQTDLDALIRSASQLASKFAEHIDEKGFDMLNGIIEQYKEGKKPLSDKQINWVKQMKKRFNVT